LAIQLLAPGTYAWLGAAAATGAGVLALACWPLRLVVQARERAERRADDLRRRREAELTAKVEALRRDERDAIKRREEARRSVEDAELEIEEIKDGQHLYRFIEERARGQAYSKYLGLVSIVRKDFERLGELIDHHDAGAGDGRPRLERIVLYVDDLDRCPAHRVVEVLEAVHLLLASELFVVIVAVDPRWLVSSLEHRYETEMPGSNNGRRSAAPQDYLEKIFQIPFSLPPMSAEGYRRLMESLIATEEAGGDRRQEASGVGPRGAAQPALGGAGSSDFDAVRVSGSPDSLAPASIDLRPEGLRVTADEVDYLGRLDLMVATPRAAKRLANLYRLVRVSISQRQLALLLGSEGGRAEFPCVQLLLAITVGFPSIAAPLFDDLEQRDEGSWWSFVDSRQPRSSETHAWKQLLVAIEPLRDEHFPDDLARMVRWLPRIAQFSYGLRTLDSE
jgi:hypothetical protein